MDWLTFAAGFICGGLVAGTLMIIAGLILPHEFSSEDENATR